jgi:Secretion system C-terminal sorting domain
MKKITLLFAMICMACYARAQNIVSAEYYWDQDPGVGAATSLTITTPSQDVTQSFNISTSGLSEGHHVLCVRTKNSLGQWSTIETREMHIHKFTEAEYFWDHDPGAGNGTSLTLNTTNTDVTSNYNVSTTGLAGGTHVLYTRALGIGGTWGVVKAAPVYVENKIIAAEYFWNSDPGAGNASAMNIGTPASELTFSDNVSTVGMREGNQFLYTRIRSYGQTWSTAVATPVFIENKIIAAEYFWNQDPGVGNGTALNIGTPSSTLTFTDDVSTASLDTTVNIHYLVVRTMGKNGSWSVQLDTALFLGPVGVEVLKNHGFSTAVFPNPATDFFNLSMFSMNNKTIQVYLENSNGQRIEQLFNGNFGNRKDIKIDVSQLSKGIYFVHYICEDTQWSQRIMVQ